MDYAQTLEFLFEQLPMYQRLGKAAYKKDLTNTKRLLQLLENPEKKLKFVHIAGTNGKGTSAHGIAAALQIAGYRTGLYTSPHLKSFTERIRINGQEVSKDFVVDFVSHIKAGLAEIQPSFFEITVAMAFSYFQEDKVDIAVIETGLGGRLDSTNVITPEVSLITSIGFDHMDMLGDTLEKIAFEKAGIIKPHIPVVVNEPHEETLPVFQKIAAERNAKLVLAEKVDWKPNGLVPDYLLRNLPGIYGVIKILRDQGWEVSELDVKKGVTSINQLTGLRGRLQVLEQQPLVIADISHNAEGLRVLFDQVSAFTSGVIHLIFGTVRDKDLGRIFQEFPGAAKLYWTQSSVPRAMPAVDLQAYAQEQGWKGEVFSDVNQAIMAAKGHMTAGDTLLVTGSTFVVSEIENL